MTIAQPSDSASQTPLFDHGQHAKATRAAAASAAKEKGPNRRLQILTLLRSRGTTGATRHEIADAMGWPLSSVCSPVLELLRTGDLIENGEKRKTQFGSMAAVIVVNPLKAEG
ncbi:hypothetical protein Enr13x_27930 [Stieleria neptunia]|uniref:MarR family protein n=1 Tax=Stieleria neptunia TaxID=2527979 RepID=A0A518HQ44_9BACT|nr:hypothetical protein [Stieleria neptunia]QDV42941.1 hypothetical protein Enr13x_27930 [Stieleria neptunia]